MIAYYSSLAMVTSAVLYLLAMTLHAGEWAAARTSVPSRRTALVGAGAGTSSEVGARPGPRLNVDLAAASGSASAESEPAELEPAELQPAELGPAEPKPAAASSRGELLGRAALGVTMIAAATHVAGVVLRGIAAGRAPWGNMYEFVTTSLGIAAIAYMVLVVRFGMRWLGLPVTLLLAIGQGLAVTVFYVDVSELMPALHSVWFIIHIIAAATAGAAFNLGGIAALLFLWRTRAEAKGGVRGYLAQLPAAEVLDRISYRCHAFAFPLWTFTIAAGAIWAQFAWGRFWGWDPKETWSLITWIIYAGYLHARATAGWKGRRAAILAVVGLFSFWFNFVGINLLTSGLHSYAGI